MTTIAWDGKTLAADTMIGDTNKVIYHGLQHFKLMSCDAGIFGAAGHAGKCAKYFDGDAQNQKTPPEGIEVIRVFDGKGYAYFGGGWIPIRPPYAIGSGALAALAAMMAGADAVKAVEIACHLTQDSGLPVIKKQTWLIDR